MRYKITDSNVRIEFLDRGMEAIVAASYSVLVPKITPLIYFLHLNQRRTPMLERLGASDPSFRLIGGSEDDSTYLKHFRIVEDYGVLYIAPNSPGRLNRKIWKNLFEDIDERSRTEEFRVFEP